MKNYCTFQLKFPEIDSQKESCKQPIFLQEVF